MQEKNKSLKNLFIAFALFVFTLIASCIAQELHLSLFIPEDIAISYPPIFPIGMLAVYVFLNKQLKCIDGKNYFFRYCIKLSMFVVGFATFSTGGLVLIEILLALLPTN